MSDAHKDQAKPEGSGKSSQEIEVFFLNTNEKITYDSVNEAARVLNINHTSIVKYFANNQQKPYKGIYTFKKLL
jgi:hypothetical protein